jgi:uncharacterized peroxidase-related enzyme
MNRITPIDPAVTSGKAQELLAAVKAKVGTVPNVFRILGNSPAALEGYLKFSTALAGGTLSAKVREQISLALAESHQCGYCLSAHTFYAGKLGLTEQEIVAAKLAISPNTKTDAVLKFARNVVAQRGKINDTDFQAARDAGLTDAEIVEVIAHVALNTFTNYMNLIAETALDFPKVEPGESSAGEDACSIAGCDCVE